MFDVAELDPFRARLWRSLHEEERSGGAVRITLHHHRPIAEMRQQVRSDVSVILEQISLVIPSLGQNSLPRFVSLRLRFPNARSNDHGRQESIEMIFWPGEALGQWIFADMMVKTTGLWTHVPNSVKLGDFRRQCLRSNHGGHKTSAPPQCPLTCELRAAPKRFRAKKRRYVYFFGRTVSFIALPTRNFKVVLAGI